MHWIVEDVLPDRVQGFVVADDVLVVIALPDVVDMRMGLVTPILKPRTIEPMVLDGDRKGIAFCRGEKSFAPAVSAITMIP